MSAESTAAKARRYLTEGRVVLVRVTEFTARANVRGDGQTYTVTVAPSSSSCTCLARSRCAHQLAVGLVTAIPPARASS